MKTLLAILLLATTAFAQQKTPPAPGAARPLNLPKITEKKLSNGLTVVLAPLPNVPKVSAILTFRSATTASDRDAHPGIAQIAASVANEGTDTRTSKQLKEELRSTGGSLGRGTDADSAAAVRVLVFSSTSVFKRRSSEIIRAVVSCRMRSRSARSRETICARS